MGRKNKRKTNKGRRDASPLINNDSNRRPLPAGLAFLEKSRRRDIDADVYDVPRALFPDKPDMALGPMAMATMRAKLFALPAENRTATSERLVRAHKMMEEVEKLQAGRDPGADLVEMDTLTSDASYIRECVLWIKAFVSSDFRVACSPSTLFGSPLPSCWTHITSLHPLDDNQPQLMRLDALSFVVLLAAAIRLCVSAKGRFGLQIVHELHTHAEGGYDWLDFDDLKKCAETKDLDEAYLRFSLAWTGIKEARRLYRDREQRTSLPFHSKDDVAIQSISLLRSIEIFAKEQCRYNPKSPVGNWNLGFTCREVKYNGQHPWKAIVDFYNQMAECCLLADEADDDFYRAAAGVEVALSLVLGGKSVVGYKVPSGAKVQVLRDVAATTPSCSHGDGRHQIKVGGGTPTVAREACAKELRRVREGVPPTLLEPGETVLVPHWEVQRVWNFAMEAYVRLQLFECGWNVYGETTGWNTVEAFLKGKYGPLVPRRYVTCPQVGFKSTRDKGSWPCDYCGKVTADLKQCSVCKKVQYCSRDCQKKAWKATHKHECIAVG